MYYDQSMEAFNRAQREYENQEPPEAKVSTYCTVCGDEIYEGDDCYKVGGEYYCNNCVQPTTAPDREDYQCSL